MEYTKFILTHFINACYVVLMGRVLLSFVDMRREHRVTQFLYHLTEPVIAPIRNVLPRVGMFDFSVLVVFVLLGFMQRFVVAL